MSHDAKRDRNFLRARLPEHLDITRRPFGLRIQRRGGEALRHIKTRFFLDIPHVIIVSICKSTQDLKISFSAV